MSGSSAKESETVLGFGPFRLIPARGLLLEGDKPCRLGSRALLLLTELVERAGETVSKQDLLARAWPDTFAPTSKIWADDWNVAAVYSPDGMTIQFDNGTIWQRDIGPPPPLRVVRVRKQAALR